MELQRSSFERRLLEALNFSKEEIELSISPIKSDYQKNLEEKGWEFITNVKAVNGLMDYTKDRKTFRFLIDDYKHFYPGKKVRLTRSHNTYGERIPSKEKIVAIYAQDRE